MAHSLPRPHPAWSDTEDTAAAPTPAIANGTLYNLFAVGGLLGHRGRSVGWLCKYLDALIAHDGFPQPLPLRLPDNTTSRRAHRDSRWPSVAVDAWIAGQVSPRLVEAVDLGILAAASNRLDARARNLTVINGGRA